MDEVVIDVEDRQQSIESVVDASNLTLPVSICDELLLVELDGIPNKLAFKIGEVAELLSVKQYVLRYWESEFDQLKPQKSRNGQRVYTRKDVEVAFLIKKLLYQDRFSIEGARSALKGLRFDVKRQKSLDQQKQTLKDVRSQLDDLLSELRSLKEKFI